ncbi:hypothetical protein HYV87_04540 [Candidatus Woesearchaeota archaeon]|nr:hypothetical protein [Candidatus Woesearchaeota archaeon]MBI2582364.1 hypothetical protein [Candidatus Woesearchaeota archaeon]
MKAKIQKYKVKSVVVSRKPSHKDEEVWHAFIGFFDENNPHLKGKVPFEVVEIQNVQKVRINELKNISYYLMGNDIVINNLEELTIQQEDGVVTLTGKQNLAK